MNGMELNWDEDQRILRVAFSGRLDAATAELHEQKLFRALEHKENDTCLIDAEKLGYISSGGLRLILDVKKRCDDTRIINVSLDIYDILSMTGFTKFLPVERRIREVKQPAPTMLLCKESDGEVFRSTDDMVVKIFNPDITYDYVQKRLQLTKAAITHGIPAPIAFEIVKCDDRFGVISEKIYGETLADLWKAHPDSMQEEISMLAELMLTLHDSVVEEEELPDYKERMIEEVKQNRKLTADEQQKLIHLADILPPAKAFIHGNLRLSNILKQDGRLILLDLTRCGYGNAILDLQTAASAMCADGHEKFWQRFFDYYTRNLDKDKRDLLENSLHPEIKPWWM